MLLWEVRGRFESIFLAVEGGDGVKESMELIEVDVEDSGGYIRLGTNGRMTVSVSA